MNSVTQALDNRIAVAINKPLSVNEAKALIKRETGLDDSQITLISSKGDSQGQSMEKLEGAPKKLAKEFLWLHLLFASVGLATGMLIAYLLVEMGPEFTQKNPLFTYIALISPGIFIGLFVSGLLSLKPQNDALNMEVVERQDSNLSSLVIKTNSLDEKKSVEKVVKSINGLTLVD